MKPFRIVFIAALSIGLAFPGLAAEDFLLKRERWQLRDAGLREASGLAASRRDGAFLWSLNDSGAAAALHLLDDLGGAHGVVRIQGVANRDWEDLDSFVLSGKSYLLIADTGDNAALRKSCAIIIVPEPDIRSGRIDGTIAPSWTIRFRYEDGPRDCESVAASVPDMKILLISKRTWPPMLYELPLRPTGADTMQIARRVGPVNLPRAGVLAGPYASQPTGLTVSPDGRLAAVLTYARVFLFHRSPQESWAEAFAKEPVALPAHRLEQAEGIGFSRDGQRIHVVSEGKFGRMVTYKRE